MKDFSWTSTFKNGRSVSYVVPERKSTLCKILISNLDELEPVLSSLGREIETIHKLEITFGGLKLDMEGLIQTLHKHKLWKLLSEFQIKILGPSSPVDSLAIDKVTLDESTLDESTLEVSTIKKLPAGKSLHNMSLKCVQLKGVDKEGIYIINEYAPKIRSIEIEAEDLDDQTLSALLDGQHDSPLFSNALVLYLNEHYNIRISFGFVPATEDGYDILKKMSYKKPEVENSCQGDTSYKADTPCEVYKPQSERAEYFLKATREAMAKNPESTFIYYPGGGGGRNGLGYVVFGITDSGHCRFTADSRGFSEEDKELGEIFQGKNIQKGEGDLVCFNDEEWNFVKTEYGIIKYDEFSQSPHLHLL